MSQVKKNKNLIYKRRQNTLLAVIATILIILILILVYLVAFADKKGISQKATVDTLSSKSDHLEAIPVDGQEETLDINNIKFKKSSITLKVGDKTTPEIIGADIDDVKSWDSTNKSVAVVDENGEISAIGKGTAEISAILKDSYLMINLDVEVVAEDTDEEDNENKNDDSSDDDSDNAELTYIDGILIANKSYSLPSDYAPGVDPEAEAAFYTMQADASYEGLDIYIASGFRSYEDQDRIYNNYASYDGYEVADTYSARPGHSEHQTGLAFDLNSIEDSFAYTPEGEWVKNNAHKYGFIIRYPEGKEHITGYMYEPWHIRYLGIETATSVYESGLTLEEYLGIDSVYAE